MKFRKENQAFRNIFIIIFSLALLIPAVAPAIDVTLNSITPATKHIITVSCSSNATFIWMARPLTMKMVVERDVVIWPSRMGA